MQRKIVLMALPLLLVSLSTAFPKDDPFTGIGSQAKKEKRPAIVYFFKRYCTYCSAMEKDVLRTKEIQSEMKKTVVFARIDSDKRPDIARQNNVMGYPTTILLDESGKKIVQVPGYISKKDFKRILGYLGGRHYKKMSLREYLGGK